MGEAGGLILLNIGSHKAVVNSVTLPQGIESRETEPVRHGNLECERDGIANHGAKKKSIQ